MIILYSGMKFIVAKSKRFLNESISYINIKLKSYCKHDF